MFTRRRVRGDAGTTLMELTVGMAIMSIFMAICTGAVVSMYSSTNKTQAVVDGSAQLNTAFDHLDAQVRYADRIDHVVAPPAGPYWSVAFQTDDPASTTCRQLTVRPIDSTTQLDLVEYTWALTVDPSGSLSPPGTKTRDLLATNVTLVVNDKGETVDPFAMVPADDTVQHQQLQLRLGAVGGFGKAQTESYSEISFSALNSLTPNTARTSTSLGSVCSPVESP